MSSAGLLLHWTKSRNVAATVRSPCLSGSVIIGCTPVHSTTRDGPKPHSNVSCAVVSARSLRRPVFTFGDSIAIALLFQRERDRPRQAQRVPSGDGRRRVSAA